MGWNVHGFSTYYEVKLIDNQYKIIDTNLFDVVGVDNVFKFVLKVFAIIIGLFLSIGAIVATIITIVIIKNRKKKQLTN